MARYRRRGKRWNAEVRVRGQYQSATFASKTAAREWAERVEADIIDGNPTSSQTLEDALIRYRDEVSPSKRGYKWERDRINLMLRTMPFIQRQIGQVAPEDIIEWLNQRNIKPSSKRRELTLLSGIYTTARRVWRWTNANPVADVPKPAKPPARSQDITDDQIQAVFDAAGYTRRRPPINKSQLACAAFDLSLETAMRAGEIRSLCADTMYIDQRYVILPETKNGDRREVPLSAGAVEILQLLDPERPFPMSGDQLSAIFRKVVAKAGMKGQFTFHDARAVATKRLSRKLSIYQLARVTGHRDLSQLLVYYRQSASELAGLLD